MKWNEVAVELENLNWLLFRLPPSCQAVCVFSASRIVFLIDGALNRRFRCLGLYCDCIVVKSNFTYKLYRGNNGEIHPFEFTDNFLMHASSSNVSAV